MPRTKPLYIYASNEDYNNLSEELADIHQKLQGSSTDGIKEQILELVKEVEKLKSSTSDANSVISKELKDARGTFDSINDRFLALDQYDILNQLNKVTTTREYEYIGNTISKEKVRGDFNYDNNFNYDNQGNIISEIKTDLDGVVISEKHYTYTEDGDIATVTGTNTDDVMLLSNALVDKDQTDRIAAIEKINFVELGLVLEGWELVEVAKTVQELVTAVQHLMLNLPENIGYLIDTSEVFRRLDGIEQRLNENEVYHSFDVASDTMIYTIPDVMVGKNFSVFMEGLLLEHNVDYKIDDSKIEFLMPLIDGFTITLKN